MSGISLALALCAIPLSVQAQVAFRAAGAQVVGTGSSITPAIPGGTQSGDFAVLIVAGRPTNTTQPAAPAGWTLRSSSLREVGANDLKVMTFYRFLGASNPNPVVSLPAAWQGNAGGMSGQIAVWSGVNAATPFDVADVTGNTAAGTTWTPPAITTVTAEARIVSAVATSDDNALSIGTAQGFTARMIGASYDTTTGGDHSVGLADKAQLVAGLSTPLTWNQTTNAPDQWAAITFALRPINTPPQVTLTSPLNGAVFVNPANITLSATASDSDGTIARVEFTMYGIGGEAEGYVIAQPPYTMVWTPPAPPTFPYEYTIKAFSYDNEDEQSWTSSATIYLDAPRVGSLHFVHVDHLNTPRAIYDDQQQLRWKWDQAEPFAVNVPDENPAGRGTFEFALRFPGQYFDKETGLHYSYFRDYDPELGRFPQFDPIGLRGGINGYAYADLNPLSKTDPFGLAAQTGGAGNKMADCGPEGGWLNRFVPNNPRGYPFQNCCDAHDKCYDKCFGPDKLSCDADACDCFKKACGSSGSATSTCLRIAQEYCYRIIYSETADEQFKKARAKCKSSSACIPNPTL